MRGAAIMLRDYDRRKQEQEVFGMTYNDYKAAQVKASKFLKKPAVTEITSGQFNAPDGWKKRTVDITTRCGAQFSESIGYRALSNKGHVTKIKKLGSAQRRAGVSAKDAQAAGIELAEAVSRWTEEKRLLRDVREIQRWSSSRAVRYCGTGHKHGVRSFRTTTELAKNLDAQRKRAIADHIDFGAHGWVNVEWVSSPDECGISVNEEYDPNGYSRSCKYAMTVRAVSVRAVAESRRNLVGGDRRIYKGCVALSCKPITAPELNVEVQAYDAVVARKSVGIYYEVRHAIILATEYRKRHVVAGENMDNALARLRRAMAKSWNGDDIEVLDVEAVRNELLAGNIEVNQDMACALIQAIDMYASGAGDLTGMIRLLAGFDDAGVLADIGIVHAVARNPEINYGAHKVVLEGYQNEINSRRDRKTPLDVLVDRMAPRKLINLYLDHGADETLLDAQRSVDFDRIMGSRT